MGGGETVGSGRAGGTLDPGQVGFAVLWVADDSICDFAGVVESVTLGEDCLLDGLDVGSKEPAVPGDVVCPQFGNPWEEVLGVPGRGADEHAVKTKWADLDLLEALSAAGGAATPVAFGQGFAGIECLG